MKFNRASHISLLVCLHRFVFQCSRYGHVWIPWSWRRYQLQEYRICQRCGYTQDRKFNVVDYKK